MLISKWTLTHPKMSENWRPVRTTEIATEEMKNRFAQSRDDLGQKRGKHLSPASPVCPTITHRRWHLADLCLSAHDRAILLTLFDKLKRNSVEWVTWPKHTNIKDAYALPEVSSLLRCFKGHCFHPYKASWTLSYAATSKPRVAMLMQGCSRRQGNSFRLLRAAPLHCPGAHLGY